VSEPFDLLLGSPGPLVGAGGLGLGDLDELVRLQDLLVQFLHANLGLPRPVFAALRPALRLADLLHGPLLGLSAELLSPLVGFLLRRLQTFDCLPGLFLGGLRAELRHPDPFRSCRGLGLRGLDQRGRLPELFLCSLSAELGTAGPLRRFPSSSLGLLGLSLISRKEPLGSPLQLFACL
jgi:hypothetical protein